MGRVPIPGCLYSKCEPFERTRKEVAPLCSPPLAEPAALARATRRGVYPGSIQTFHLEAAEFHGVVMAGESNVAAPVVESLGGMCDLAPIKGVAIYIEDLGAIECDRNFLAADFDFLVVPGADGPQVAVFGSDTVVE